MYTQEQYDQLPDFMKAEMVKSGDGWKHAGLVKVKQTADDLDRRSKETATELENYKLQEKERIELAKKEAYEKALAEGKTDEVARQLKEKLADVERRSEESAKEFKERMAKLAAKQESAIAAELSSHAIKGSEATFKRLLKGMISVDPETDEETYLDEDGRAMSLNKAEFIEWLKKSNLFAPIMQANVTTTGAGNANGSSKGSASIKKKFGEMSGAELAALRKEDPAAYERLKNEFNSQ